MFRKRKTENLATCSVCGTGITNDRSLHTACRVIEEQEAKSRRTFLRGAGAALGGAIVAPIATSSLPVAAEPLERSYEQIKEQVDEAVGTYHVAPSSGASGGASCIPTAHLWSLAQRNGASG